MHIEFEVPNAETEEMLKSLLDESNFQNPYSIIRINSIGFVDTLVITVAGSVVSSVVEELVKLGLSFLKRNRDIKKIELQDKENARSFELPKQEAKVIEMYSEKQD